MLHISMVYGNLDPVLLLIAKLPIYCHTPVFLSKVFLLQSLRAAQCRKIHHPHYLTEMASMAHHVRLPAPLPALPPPPWPTANVQEHYERRAQDLEALSRASRTCYRWICVLGYTPFVRSDRMSELVGGWREQSAAVCQAESIVHVAYINAAQTWVLAIESQTKRSTFGRLRLSFSRRYPETLPKLKARSAAILRTTRPIL